MRVMSKGKWLAVVLALAMVLPLIPAIGGAEESCEPSLLELEAMLEADPGLKLEFNPFQWVWTDATFRMIVEDIGYDGPGWCVDAGTRIESGPNAKFDGNVYISTSIPADAPVCVTERPWGEINWILNNWKGEYGWRDAQVAMWSVIHDYDFTGVSLGWFSGWNQNNVNALVTGANKNAGFEPGIDDLVAVALLSCGEFPGYDLTEVPPWVKNRGDAKQMVIIERPKKEVPTYAGCTPGYWRQPAYRNGVWSDADVYGPYDLVTNVFDLAFTGSNNLRGGNARDWDAMTLYDGLAGGGGPGVEGAQTILIRAAIASLLNAQHENVPFEYAPDTVIDMVNEALETGDRGQILELAEYLDKLNNRGCTLNAFGEVGAK